VVPIPAVFGSPREPVVINFALPKGRMMDNVVTLLKGTLPVCRVWCVGC
jgi:hypothetical protein